MKKQSKQAKFNKFNKKVVPKELKKINLIYRNTKEAKIKDRCRAILLRTKGYLIGEIAAILGVSQEVIKDWSQIFLKEGVQGLIPKPRISNHKYLTEEQKQQLKQDLKHQPKQLGFKEEFWTIDILREHIKKKFKLVYKSNQSYYDLFKYCGYTCQKPRPKDKRQDENQIKKFMKHTRCF